MKYLNDYNNTIEYAKKEGMEKGVIRGMKRGVAIGETRGLEKGVAIGETRGLEIGRQQISNLFALLESGVSLAEAKRKFGLEN